jgi:hypothetical protein
MINKLPILINTVLFGILLAGCKPVGLQMTGDKELIESKDDNPTDGKRSEAEEFDEGTIQAILKENNLLDNPNKALFWALENDLPDVVKYLICRPKWLIWRKRANVNAKNNFGKSSLHLAAFNGHTAIAELLIKVGAQINEKDNFGMTPLHVAAVYNNVSFFELLTRLNINSSGRLVRLGALNEVEAFRRLLGSEIFDKNLVGVMLSYGDFNVNMADNRGKTPLDIAKEKGYTKIVKILEGIMSRYENQ